MINRRQARLSVITVLVIIIASFIVGYVYLSKLSGTDVQASSNSTSSGLKQTANTRLDFAWPPQIDRSFPDIELFSHTGEMVKLSSFKGKVILVEPVGMNCAACNAFSGAAKKGGYEGTNPQQNLSPIESLLPQYGGGISLDDNRIVLVQLLLYDMQLKAPKKDDARKWAEHFGFENNKNVVVLAGDERYINKASYNMIPGFFLIDKDFILRSDSTGHHPKHNLFTELLPKVPWLANAVKVKSVETDKKINSVTHTSFDEKLYSALNLKMPVEKAYRSIPHKQTTFNPASAKMSKKETQFLHKLFAIVDVAIVERVQTLLWYQTKGRRGAKNDNYKLILSELEDMDVPASLKQPYELIYKAIKEQNEYFQSIDITKRYAFNSNGMVIQSVHSKLIQAYNLLMAQFPTESKHNKEAFFDHLCALDFI